MAATTIESMMKHFHAELGSEKMKWLMANFSGSKTIEEMFTFLWDFEESHKYLNPVLLPSEKSEEEAQRLQAKGDTYLDEGCIDEALEQYNLSIMNAPHPTVSLAGHNNNKTSESALKLLRSGDFITLSSGYAKRSAALFELGQIEQCLNDIHMALTQGYPDTIGDLEDRKAKCITLKNNNFNRNCELIESFESPLKMTSTANVAQNFPKVTDSHHTLPSLSSALKIVYLPEKGRHIIAERDIFPGEVLGMERSCCSSLDLAKLPSHCSTCLTKSLAPLPCPDCAMAVFCSDACRDEGLSGNHWLECRLLPTMAALALQPVLGISFKLLQRYSCEQLRDYAQNFQEETKDCPYGIRDINKNGSCSFRSLRAIDHLVSNKDERPSGDLYVKCFIALLLTKLLLQSERFFVNSCGESVTPTREDILFTGQMIFSNHLKISCNGFKLIEFQRSNYCNEMERKDIGSGVFPILCLFNHSCHPNSEPYSYGCIQVVRASRLILAGSEVTESYSRGFYLQPKSIRQKSLLNVFQFHCTCEACEASWPTYQELPGTLQFRCLDCIYPVSETAAMCMNCFLGYDKKDYEPSKQLLVDEWCNITKQVQCSFAKSQQIASKMMLGQTATKDDLSAICLAIVLMEKYVPFPCQPLWDAHDAFDLYFHLEREKDNINSRVPDVK